MANKKRRSFTPQKKLNVERSRKSKTKDSGFDSPTIRKRECPMETTPLSSFPTESQPKRRNLRKLPYKEKIVNDYFAEINQSADTICDICVRMLYPSSLCVRTLTLEVEMVAHKYNFELSKKYYACWNCYTIITKGIKSQN